MGKRFEKRISSLSGYGEATVRTNPDSFFVALCVDDGSDVAAMDLDAAGVGILVGQLTHWLAERADRL